MATAESQRSALRDFLGSIATIRGDLSNITAPPFVLSEQSTTELPSYWAEYPSIFTAPAAESTPEKRALLVLKWFLACLRRQQYAGRDESAGVKKPLNAFLGELFIADFEDAASGTTHLVSEQVSHHPPITATCLWNDAAGIRAEGYACQKITFNGSVNIKQMGHAIITLTEHNETHLIPLPAVKVSGILTGTPYPELGGHYTIVSSSGLVSEVDFSGKRMLGLTGQRHHVRATVHRADDAKREAAVFEIEGEWNGELAVRAGDGATLESIDVRALSPVEPKVPAVDGQSPYESRRAWHGVRAALAAGDMQGVVDAKSKVEEAQRGQRKQEEQRGAAWQPVFFKRVEADPVYEELAAHVGREQADDSKLHGFWKFDFGAAEKLQRPYRDGTPWEVPQ